MTDSSKEQYMRDDFIKCNWSYDAPSEDDYVYLSIIQSLSDLAKEKSDIGEQKQADILNLLGRAASMMLTPDSINEPFSPYFQNYHAGTRSPVVDDFKEDELVFFGEILDDIQNPWVIARIADLLWLCRKPKDPNYAKIAIESYIASPIEPETWNAGINNHWERAARLCMQIKDFDKLDEIKKQLFSAFKQKYPENKYMKLWVATLLDNLQIDSDYKEDIASILFEGGSELMKEKDFFAAVSFFELATKKYSQSDDKKRKLESLIQIANSYEGQGDIRIADSNMVANQFYNDALQAYRRVPRKYRNEYDIDRKIEEIRTKITNSGESSLGEMGLVETEAIDISKIAKASIAHVSGKSSFDEALLYFIGLYSGPEYKEQKNTAKESIKNHPLSNLFSSIHLSTDGRTVAHTPSMDLNSNESDSANQSALNRTMQQHFAMEIQLLVNGKIIPALSQLLMEHRATKGFFEAICLQSPIVPIGRERLLGHALWLGFEYEFGSALHLLCPQIEHIVRVQLKEAGAHTTHIDKDGIEHEVGLSSLMELAETEKVFGEDLVFEIKSVFTDALGFNLRNEVAHGLLDDSSSDSIPAIYAWWMTLRIVIHSITR